MEHAHTPTLVKSGLPQNSGTLHLPVVRDGAIYWSKFCFLILFSAEISAPSDTKTMPGTITRSPTLASTGMHTSLTGFGNL